MRLLILISLLTIPQVASAHEGEFTCGCNAAFGKYTGTNAELHCTANGVQNKDNPSFTEDSWMPLKVQVTEKGQTATFTTRARVSLNEDRVSGTTWKDVGMSIEKWEEYFSPFSTIECSVAD